MSVSGVGKALERILCARGLVWNIASATRMPTERVSTSTLLCRYCGSIRGCIVGSLLWMWIEPLENGCETATMTEHRLFPTPGARSFS